MQFLFDKIHLNDEIPFDIFENHLTTEEYSSGNNIRIHLHECLELNYIVEGEGDYFIDSKMYNYHAGDVLIINNLEYHGITRVQNTDIKVIIFDPSFVWSGSSLDYQFIKAFYEYKSDYNHLIPKSSQTEQINAIIHEIEEESENKIPGYQLVIKSLLMKILALIYRGYESVGQEPFSVQEFSKNYAKIADSINYINGNFRDRLTLDQLADLSHMSQNYFSYFFGSVMHCSPFEYIKKRRIEYACRRLISTSDSITQISIDSGYSNIPYFNRIFKEEMKVSPTQFRKSYLSGAAGIHMLEKPLN